MARLVWRPDAARRGVAAAFSLVVLIALALLSALFLEAALADLRWGSGVLASVRVGAVSEGALERGLSHRLDSADLGRNAGATLLDERSSGPDSVHTLIRLLQAGVVEVRVSVVSRRGGFRVIAGRVAYATALPDPADRRVVLLRPLASHWWAPMP